MRKLLFFIFLIFYIDLTFAASVDHNYFVWTNIKWRDFTEDHPIDYTLQLHTRYLLEAPGFHQAVVRGGVAYSPIENLSLWVGSDFVPTQLIRNGEMRYENRVWQQVQLAINLKKNMSIVFRSRLEQRFLHGRADVALRLRERLYFYLSHLFHFTPDKMTPVVYDEIFFNLNRSSWVPRKVIDQNRLFIGYAIKLKKYFVLQVGYMNQFQAGRSLNFVNHILYASFIFSPADKQ